jgi:hypothetical protein
MLFSLLHGWLLPPCCFGCWGGVEAAGAAFVGSMGLARLAMRRLSRASTSPLLSVLLLPVLLLSALLLPVPLLSELPSLAFTGRALLAVVVPLLLPLLLLLLLLLMSLSSAAVRCRLADSCADSRRLCSSASMVSVCLVPPASASAAVFASRGAATAATATTAFDLGASAAPSERC